MHKIKACLLALPLLLAVLAGLTSCDKVIYDYEGDCSIHYVVNFRYDYNMLDADAFASQVECITLYVIDSNSNIVLKQSDEGAALAEEGYQMEFEVDPGVYTLVAWGKARDFNSFTVYDGGSLEDMTCTLGCSYDAAGAPYVDGEVDELFYGIRDSVVFGTAKGETYYATVPLMKDTNSIRIALQQIAGGDVHAEDFTFTIQSDNWFLGWDNEIIADEELTYYAFYTADFEADGSFGTNPDDEDDPAVTPAPAFAGSAVAPASVSTRATTNTAYAEFTISRLMADGGTRVVIYNNKTGETTLSYPLAQLATIFKGYYNGGWSNQEFLDREDTYDMTFFLDNGNRWVGTSINIESWHVVLQNSDL